MRESIKNLIDNTKPETMVDHNLVPELSFDGLLVEKRQAKRRDGSVAEGLYNMWITLDNPAQYNSYTTEMVKGAISPSVPRATPGMSTPWSLPARVKKRSVPAATPRSTPNTMPEIPRSTASTCASLTIWCRRCWPAISR